MTSLFMNAMQSNDSRTANGAVTHSTSGNECLNLFFTIGAMRGNDQSLTAFNRAFGENPELATRILLWSRDVRGGAGERGTFRKIFARLCKEQPEVARLVMRKIPELGRFDDLVSAFGTSLEADAITLWTHAIVNDKNALAAKWFPRERSKNAVVFKRTIKSIGVNAKQWRKVISLLSDTVEQKMCARNWDEIEFGKLPSVASARYQKAFGRNAESAYGEYITSLVKGEAKINAGAVYPYDVVRSVKMGDHRVANEQWKALPNYMEGSDERVIPVVDVSGSMGCGINGEHGGSVTCKEVAMSLGIYVAERNEGIFKDQFISFSSDPHFHKLTGDSLKSRLDNMQRSGEDMSTNITRCFEVLLERARTANLSQDEMPTKLLIMSDMEFDQARTGGGWHTRNTTNFDAIKVMYANAGYEMPQLVFWNLRGRLDNVPVKSGEANTALVSGCSPSILTSLLGGELEPVKIMLKTVGVDRYAL
ncbi:RNA-binding protein [Vibrio phage D480]